MKRLAIIAAGFLTVGAPAEAGIFRMLGLAGESGKEKPPKVFREIIPVAKPELDVAPTVGRLPRIDGGDPFVPVRGPRADDDEPVIVEPAPRAPAPKPDEAPADEAVVSGIPEEEASPQQ